MILILSIKNDVSTEDVINWLKWYNEDFIRINPEDTLQIEELRLDDKDDIVIRLDFKGSKIDFSQIKSFWYRRGDLNLYDFSHLSNEVLEPHFRLYLQRELSVIQELLYSVLESKFNINKRTDNETNKLINLILASNCGLTTPGFTVKNAISPYDVHEQKISKALYNGSFKINGKFSIGAGTHRLNETGASRFPSLLQNEIKKKFEVRVFYLMGEFYAVAIFSQQSEQTKVDFRNYDRTNPNRLVPLELPTTMKYKIDVFMRRTGINCGSLDFIYSLDGIFYFLEVNPIGQFQQVSIPGNYYLEKNIAEKLILAHE